MEPYFASQNLAEDLNKDVHYDDHESNTLFRYQMSQLIVPIVATKSWFYSLFSFVKLIFL